MMQKWFYPHKWVKFVLVKKKEKHLLCIWISRCYTHPGRHVDDADVLRSSNASYRFSIIPVGGKLTFKLAI